MTTHVNRHFSRRSWPQPLYIVVVDHHSFSFHAISDHIGKPDNGLLAPQLLFIFLEFSSKLIDASIKVIVDPSKLIEKSKVVEAPPKF
jgi:hypothetical protein